MFSAMATKNQDALLSLLFFFSLSLFFKLFVDLLLALWEDALACSS